MSRWVLCLDVGWVNMETKGVFKGYDQASLGTIPTVVELENKPAAVDEFNWSVSIVDRDPVGWRVGAVVALMPSCASLCAGRLSVALGVRGTRLLPSRIPSRRLAMVRFGVCRQVVELVLYYVKSLMGLEGARRVPEGRLWVQDGQW